MAKKSGGKISAAKRLLGLAGENYATELLVKAGLRILMRNYRCPKGEIDIIAGDGDMLVFVEVRARSSAIRGWGEESVITAKKQRLQAVATYYILEQGWREWPSVRFDVIALRPGEQGWQSNWIKGIT